MNIKRPLCLVCLFLTGAIWLLLKVFPPSYEALPCGEGESCTLVGDVYQKETKADYDGAQIPVIYIRLLSDPHVHVMCLLKGDSSYTPRMGEIIQIQGTIQNFKEATNPGAFDQRQYYSILKIAYKCSDATILSSDRKGSAYREGLYQIRCRFAQVLEHCLGSTDAAVMKAMLLGDKTGVPAQLRALYKQSGVMHILSISGLHISIIGMGLYDLLRRARMRVTPACVLAIAVMWSYGLMTGMSTSAFRAIVMFCIRLGAVLLGRTYDMLTALSVAALLLLFDQPLYVQHAGFLMSFGAILGVAIILPVMEPVRKSPLQEDIDDAKGLGPSMRRLGKSLAEKGIESILASLSISAVTFPVQINYYYTYPVYSLVVNLLILLFMTVVVGSGLLCMALGLVWTGLGILPGYAVHYLLSFYEQVCLVNETLPGNTWYVGHAGILQTIIYYILLVVFYLYTMHMRKRMELLRQSTRERVPGDRERTGRKLRFRHNVRYLIPIAAVLLISIRIRQPLQMTFLDVGQGNGFVLQCAGRSYLIDGGSSSGSAVGQYVLQPYLAYEGIGYLNGVIVSHEDEDHISGILELLENSDKGGTRIGCLILPDIAESSQGENYRALIALAQARNIPVQFIKQGDQILTRQKGALGQLHGSQGALTITCLGPVEHMVTTSANAYSTILRVEYGDFSAMLTGDVEEEGLENLKAYLRQEQQQRVSVLSVPHHGSKYTTDAEFLALCRPLVSVISCGRNNRYGHPHQETLERLRDVGTETLQTQYAGAITITTDGEHMEISTYVE